MLKFKGVFKKREPEAVRSKAQEAALRAVERLRGELLSKIRSARKVEDFEKIDKELFEEHLKKVDNLVAEHSLENTLSLKFKKEMLDEMYAQATKMRQYEWAAAFAKRHGF
ncbi:MAG TPA: hypothetical protein ACFYD3_05620 [Candidatus Hypogeohydataceae bacterium YC41]